MEITLQKYTIFKKLKSKILALEKKGINLESYECYLSERDFARHPEISFSLVEKVLKEIEEETSKKLKVLWSGKTHRDLIIADRNTTIARDINSRLFYKAIKFTTELGIPTVKIYYDTTLSTGRINGKEFKFKPEKPASKIFIALYGSMNNPVDRYSNLVNCGFYEEGVGPEKSRNNAETLCINNHVKSIRRTLNLGDIGTDVVRNNGGTLILVGEKLKKPELSKMHQK